MLHYDRIDLSQGIDVAKSKNCKDSMGRFFIMGLIL